MTGFHYRNMTVEGFAIHEMRIDYVHNVVSEHIGIRVTLTVEKNADNPAWTPDRAMTVERVEIFHESSVNTEEGLRQAIKFAVALSIEHELDEWLRIDGRRWDPHA